MDLLKRSRLDKLIDKATNDLLLEPDIETTLVICDLIRSQEVSAKSAVAAIKRRLQHENPNVVLHTLYVLESIMKNCGTPVFDEVATPDFMQSMCSLTTSSHDVCIRVLTCIQNWAFVFKGKPEFRAIQNAYEELRSKGYIFPEFSENDAMFSVVSAPNWKEESSCHRCKVAFTTFRRRHHCRNCGNSFCAECSSERIVLPQFGIEKEVRVCDHCFDQLKRNADPLKPMNEKKVQFQNDQAQREQERKDRELEAREKEELELALALSASEAESKERERRCAQQKFVLGSESSVGNVVRPENGPLQLLPTLDTSEMDPELARYLNRHYWENRAMAVTQQPSRAKLDDGMSPGPQPSAPVYCSPVATPVQAVDRKGFERPLTNGALQSVSDTQVPETVSSHPNVPELTTPKQEEFLNALRASVEFFINRMKSNNQRGRSIANDTTVQALFLTLHEMHPQLLQYKQAMEERRAYFEGLQDKITQLREAREALDALRQEHATRRQLEEQEATRLRQLQMMQKLEAMRQQKRDTLEFRRRLAMEQTMQYQQQYQLPTQSLQQCMNLSVGSITPMPVGPYPNVYTLPTAAYTNTVSTPSSFLPQTTYASCSNFDNAPNYYSGQAQIPSQSADPYYASLSSDRQLGHPNAYATNASGPYAMQQLEASLPEAVSTYPLHITAPVPGQHASNNRYTSEGATTGTQLEGRPTGQSSTTTQQHSDSNNLLEGQLISFD